MNVKTPMRLLRKKKPC